MKPITITFIEVMIVFLVFTSIAIQKKDLRIWKWNTEAFEDLVFGIIVGNMMMLMIVYSDTK